MIKVGAVRIRLYEILTPFIPLSYSSSILLGLFSCMRGGEFFERGLRPLSLILPSPAKRFLHFHTSVLAGEGLGVRLIIMVECDEN